MKIFINASAFSLMISSLFAANISAANAGQIMFDNRSNAKIAKLKSKARVLKNTRQQDVVPSALGAQAVDETGSIGQTQCGSINIANQAPPNIGRPPRTTELFVLGDVINAGNSCR